MLQMFNAIEHVSPTQSAIFPNKSHTISPSNNMETKAAIIEKDTVIFRETNSLLKPSISSNTSTKNSKNPSIK